MKNLIIKCSTNSDYNGVYQKNIIESEMKDLGIDSEQMANTFWIAWVIDHMFDVDIDSQVYTSILNEKIVSLSFYCENDLVTIIKA